MDQAGQISQQWNQLSVRRSFSASDPPLSGCCLLSRPAMPGSATGDTAKFVLAASWDSSIYR